MIWKTVVNKSQLSFLHVLFNRIKCLRSTYLKNNNNTTHITIKNQQEIGKLMSQSTLSTSLVFQQLYQKQQNQKIK